MKEILALRLVKQLFANEMKRIYGDDFKKVFAKHEIREKKTVGAIGHKP